MAVATALPANAAAEPPSCTDTWTGAAGDGLWQSAGNWSTSGVPGAGDVACVGSGVTVQVTAGTNQVSVLEDQGSLAISGGSLELMDASTASIVEALTMQGGTLTGAGALDVSASFSWTGGATMSGSGSTVLEPGVSGEIEAPAGDPAVVDGRLFVNEGTLTFSSGTIFLSAGAQLKNMGTFKANSETSSYASQIGVPSGSEGAAPSFVNTGTFEKTAGMGTTTVGVVFDNGGTVDAHTGGFSFSAGEVQKAPQGDWAGNVGSAGYVLPGWDHSWGGSTGDVSYLPNATLSLLQGSRFLWMQETEDARALESPGGSLRDASTFYDSSEVRLRLNFNASYSGDLHLYAVDWDDVGRRETITVDDGSGPRTVPLDSDFSEGAWVSLPISVTSGGTVTITVDRTAGANAVLSGIFLGGEGAPAAPTVSGEPQGSWAGHVGSAGYLLPDWDGTQDVSNLPNVTTELAQGSRYRWEPESSDTHALEGPEGSSLRNASTFYDPSQVQLRLDFSKAYTGNLHLYAVDWNTEARRELITVDGQTATLASSFHDGAWVSFPISVAAGGTVAITVDHLAGSNAVLSGIFLGDEGAPPSMAVSSAPQGDWVGAFGNEGYDLAAWEGPTDLVSLPDASVSLIQGERYVWSAPTTEGRTLQSPDRSTREAATYYNPNQLQLQLKFSAAYTGPLNLYALDWDSEARRELITVGGQTAALSSSFNNGAWVSFPVSVAAGETVPVTVDHTAGSNAVLSGIFLGTIVAPTNTAVPSISGTAQDGQTVMASTGSWSGSEPISYTYQWESCNLSGEECQDLEGATGRHYTPTSGDLETTLRVRVTATNAGGSTHATSAASAEIKSGAPSELETPSISGDPSAGRTLHTAAGQWGGTENEVAYQWERCNSTGGECVDIVGATEAEYELEGGDIGSTLRARIGVSNALGSLTAISPATEAIDAASSLMNTWAPSVPGTPQSGHTLTANAGSWLGIASIGYEYQWQTCDVYGAACEDITGATASSYTLTPENVGSTIRVRVSATEAEGMVSEASAVTQPIAGATTPIVENSPAISGTGLVGDELTATGGEWSGEEPTSYGYQWESCNEYGESCSSISGATASTYILTESDATHTVRVLVTATDAGAGSAKAASFPLTVSAATLLNVAAPSISGTYEAQRPLSTDRGIWTGAGALSYSYQWKRCNEAGESCSTITGATESSYTPGEADVGHTLEVVVTATGTAGTESVLSSTTPAIIFEPLAPEDLFAPSIEGNLTSEDTLTAQTGTWVSSETISYTYQWQKCNEEGEECANISGATSSTYKPIKGDIRSTLRVVVTANNSLGSASATSYQSETVGAAGAPEVSEGPVIDGTAREGAVLFADNGTWSGSRPLSYYYQWERCNSSGASCIAIESATKPSYAATSGDVGSTLRIRVTVTNSAGSTSAVSAPALVASGTEGNITQALETAEATDPSILAPSTTATLEEQTVKPAIGNSEEVIASSDGLTSSTISKETPGEFAVNTSVGELSFTPLDSSANATTTPTIVNGAAAVFAETSHVTDTFVRPAPLGATTFLQMRSSQAPTSFSWEVGIGSDQELKELPDGSIAVVEPGSGPDLESELPGETLESPESESTETPVGKGASGEAAGKEFESALEEGSPLEKLPTAPTTTTPETTPKSGELHPQETETQYDDATSTMKAAEEYTADTVVMVIQVPKVLDASGAPVPASLSVEGNTITMTVTRSESTTFPATAEIAVAAPSDPVSATKTPAAKYGFSDPHAATFGDEESGKFVNNFDPHLKSGPLHAERARLFLNWNTSPENKELLDWLKAVKAAGLTPFITLQECKPLPESSCPTGKAPRTLGEYYNHVKKLMKGLINGNSERPAVRLWGSWNEPDHIGDPYREGPETAAYLWGEAQLAAEKAGCHHHCTVVAGEFAAYLEHHEYVNKYELAIIKGERKHHFPAKVKPHIWGMHDYSDLEQVKGVKEGDKEVLGNYVNKEAKGFVTKIKDLYRSAHIWLTEQGVILQNETKATHLYNNAVLQRLAAQDFLRLGRPSEHAEWVYDYLYRGPTAATIVKKPHAFDSALLSGEEVTEEDHHPAENPRQAYCVLALGDKEGCPAASTTQAAIPSTITPSAGTVLADVDPQGQPTTYLIEYGTTAEYGHTTTAVTVANENGKQSETVALGGLEPCTTYHYQAEAENEANGGTPSIGGDQTFKTAGCPPTEITGPLSWLEPHYCFGEGYNNFELTGKINPNGLSTTYYFEYSEEKVEGGFSSEHMGEYKTPTESVGNGTTLIKVGSIVPIKDPVIQCYVITYRLVGVSAGGTSYGESVQAFETI